MSHNNLLGLPSSLITDNCIGNQEGDNREGRKDTTEFSEIRIAYGFAVAVASLGRSRNSKSETSVGCSFPLMVERARKEQWV